MGITLHRLAKRAETNLETDILPLNIRRKRKSIKWNLEELRDKWTKKAEKSQIKDFRKPCM